MATPPSSPAPELPAPGSGHPLLVVGQDSLLGHALLAHLRSLGLETWGTTRHRQEPAACSLRLDLRDPGAALPIRPRFRAAVLCAGVTRLAACAQDPAGTRTVNVDGVLRLSRSLVERGTRVVYLGSDALPHPGPMGEYARQKAEAENRLLELDHGRGLALVVRLPKVLGPALPLWHGWVTDLRAGRPVAPYQDLPVSPLSLPFAVATIGSLVLDGSSGLVERSGPPGLTFADLAAALAGRLGVDPGLVRPEPAPATLHPLAPIAARSDREAQSLASLLDDLLAPPPPPAATLLRQALDQRAAGRHDGARATLAAAVAQEPWNRELLLHLGESFFKANRSEEGLACWRMAGGVPPGADGDLLDAAQRARLAGHWSDTCLGHPDPEEVRVQLAELLIGSGRFGEAFAFWGDVFPKRPDWPDAHKRLTAALLFSGALPLADAIFQARVDWAGGEARRLGLDRLGVRFLRDFTTHIGHQGFLDGYVKAGLLGLRSLDRPVVLYGRKPVANRCYQDYWRRYLPDVVSSPEAYGLLEPLVPFLEDHTHGWLDHRGRVPIAHTYGDYVQVQDQWERAGRGCLLELEPEHAAQGAACLQAMGVPPGAWFVALHVREDRWDRVRDAPVASYLPAIQAITARGGWVVRMGDPAMTPLPPLPQVVDYALGPHKREWMDVYLWAATRFFLCTLSGPYQVPPTFGRPCLLTNLAPVYAPAWYGADVVLPKRYWLPAEDRFLTLPELFATGIGMVSSSGRLASLGVELVDNTPEELREAVEEMLDRCEGRPVVDDADLQAAFRRVYQPVGGTNGRIGKAFVRKHAHLLTATGAP